jgi:hypothetical protein
MLQVQVLEALFKGLMGYGTAMVYGAPIQIKNLQIIASYVTWLKL